mmetsp:Transcript_126240/g.392997  ORF Transcript_126240/g.392997 Transcript_126240/m.392997 type:complete len:245 (+) Transcript_126240:158-892(+)
MGSKPGSPHGGRSVPAHSFFPMDFGICLWRRPFALTHRQESPMSVGRKGTFHLPDRDCHLSTSKTSSTCTMGSCRSRSRAAKRWARRAAPRAVQETRESGPAPAASLRPCSSASRTAVSSAAQPAPVPRGNSVVAPDLSVKISKHLALEAPASAGSSRSSAPLKSASASSRTRPSGLLAAAGREASWKSASRRSSCGVLALPGVPPPPGVPATDSGSSSELSLARRSLCAKSRRTSEVLPSSSK